MKRRSQNASSLLSRASLALLAFSLPFEVVIISAGPIEISNLELVLAGVLVVAAHLVVGERRWRRPEWHHVPRSWLLLWIVVVATLILSALLAPEFRANAVKATLRLLSGLALALAVPQLVSDRRTLRWLLIPLLLGTLVSVGVGLAEVIDNSSLAVLQVFRAKPTTVGPFVRLTGSFDHANQMGMFLEASLPLFLALWLLAREDGLWARLPLSVAGLLFLEGAVLTYSRSTIATIFVSNVLVAGLLWFQQKRRQRSALPWAGLALGVILLFTANALFNPVVRMRLLSEDDSEWYDLSFDVPKRLTVDAGKTVTTTVTVHNRGFLTWSSDSISDVRLGGHWYLPKSNGSLAYVPRWSLPDNVSPGEQLRLDVRLRAPRQPGEYRFQWDMVQENVTWFSYKNGVKAATTVVVNEAAQPSSTLSDETDAALNQIVEPPPNTAPIPGRRTLWRIAADEFLEHPLLGIGLGNFRLVYGRALDYTDWNESIHSNNWYVETLVSLGLLGALPFFAWMALFATDILRVLRRGPRSMWQIALAAAILSYFVHGLLDYFLMFNSTGLLFWLLTGMWLASSRWNRHKVSPERIST